MTPNTLKTLIAFALVALLGAGSALAGDHSQLASALDQVYQKAKAIEADAETISRELKSRNWDEAKVQNLMSNLRQNVEEVNREVEALNAHADRMTPTQKKTFELVKTKATLLQIFATRKDEMLASPNRDKQRSLIRAQADGIARRAEMLQQSTQKLRSTIS